MTGGTIFAPITGAGGAVTLIRLSGPDAQPIAEALAGPLPPPRHAALRTLRDGGIVLDHVLLTLFAAPRSFTGEDCVEFGLHGGRAVRAAVVDALVARGARPAEPGEFSRRAFYAGRIDLLQAEATADLIAAETEAQRRQALIAADALPQACRRWRETLRRLLAQQEALIDFPDEALPAEVEAALGRDIAVLLGEMNGSLATAPAAARLREGLEFVILGPPNAGKSTLLNALAGADIAITAATPGTTRDAVSTRLDLRGIPVTLTDTAGLRATDDPVEREGVKRALALAARADLVLLLAAAPDPAFYEPAPPGRTLRVVTKADLAGDVAFGKVAISARTGAGMDIFFAHLAEIAVALTDTVAAPPATRPRQVAALTAAAESLAGALTTEEADLRAENLRAAATALATLTGTVSVEEILDAVFGSFCIGK